MAAAEKFLFFFGPLALRRLMERGPGEHARDI